MDVVDGMRMELLLAIRHLERQLENVRELEFESEEEEGQGDRRRILMVSNRLPVTLATDSDGSVTWEKSSGGLVEAMDGVQASWKSAMQLMWIGWPGDEVDYERQPDVKKRLVEETGYVPVFLTSEQAELYYNGFCNDVLWPLFNYLPLNINSTVMQSRFWDAYLSANQAFADTIFEIWQPGDVIWIHDYHLMMVPQMLRKKLRDVRLGFFLHTPYPTSEVYRVLPFRQQILEALLTCDLVGFHCFSYARHFLRSCSEILGLEVSPKGVVVSGKLVRIGIFPIGTDPQKWQKNCMKAPVIRRIRELREQFNGKKVIIGVDRLDPIKGLPHKLIAFEIFLDRYPEWQGKVVLVQVAIPSRVEVEQYQKLSSDVNELVGRINSKFGKVDFHPIHYINRSIDGDELCALYTVADMMAVTSLRDGMNLVAFEYVACQQDNGVLLLSEFAGSAQSFSAAVMVNPWNISDLADSIKEALELPMEERQERYALLYEYVHKYTSMHWGTTFLDDLVQPRSTTVQHAQGTRRLHKGEVFSAYRASRRRLIFLGYDGILARAGSLPQLSQPNELLLDALHSLCDDPKNTVFIVCGHTRAQMAEWFEELNVGLIAEHGCFLKWPGVDSEWQQTLPPQDDAWREAVLPVLRSYASSVQGSFVYEKELTLSWKYHHAASEFGEWQANELNNYLKEVLSNVPTDVIMCKRFVELRPYGVSTQCVLTALFELGGEERAIDEYETDAASAAATSSLITVTAVTPSETAARHPDHADKLDASMRSEQANFSAVSRPVSRPKTDTATTSVTVPAGSGSTIGQRVGVSDKVHPSDEGMLPSSEAPYDFVLSLVDHLLDDYLYFQDPETCQLLTHRLCPDASQFYCTVGIDMDPSNADFHLQHVEEAVQLVKLCAVG